VRRQEVRCARRGIVRRLIIGIKLHRPQKPGRRIRVEAGLRQRFHADRIGLQFLGLGKPGKGQLGRNDRLTRLLAVLDHVGQDLVGQFTRFGPLLSLDRVV
jgi:hypothetical protein